MIPVVFTHQGNQDYVQTAIRQAKQWNGRVVLLGDASNAGWDVEHHHIADYFSEAALRVADYYRHMNTNPHEFELYNLQEAFVLHEFMIREGLNKIFACDSDVMIYADLTDEERAPGDYLAVYSIPSKQWDYRWSASAHSVFWTLSGLSQFCAFTKRTYTANLAKLEEKWRWHQENGVGGGICDMTLLWLFYQEHPDSIHDICQVWDGCRTFDHNIRVAENAEPDEYAMSEGLKQITWEQGQPYGWHTKLRRRVRFATLHFQDGAKPLMESYYRERP